MWRSGLKLQNTRRTLQVIAGFKVGLLYVAVWIEAAEYKTYTTSYSRLQSGTVICGGLG